MTTQPRHSTLYRELDTHSSGIPPGSTIWFEWLPLDTGLYLQGKESRHEAGERTTSANVPYTRICGEISQLDSILLACLLTSSWCSHSAMLAIDIESPKVFKRFRDRVAYNLGSIGSHASIEPSAKDYDISVERAAIFAH